MKIFKKEKKIRLLRLPIFVEKKDIPILFDNDKIPNRGYSAFAINLSIFSCILFEKSWLRKKVHRPIKFLGPNSIPVDLRTYQFLNKKSKYWGDEFLR